MADLTEIELKRIENRVRDEMTGDGFHDGPRDPDWERETLQLVETVRAAWADAVKWRHEAADADQAACIREQERDEAREQLLDAQREIERLRNESAVVGCERLLAREQVVKLKKREIDLLERLRKSREVEAWQAEVHRLRAEVDRLGGVVQEKST